MGLAIKFGTIRFIVAPAPSGYNYIFINLITRVSGFASRWNYLVDAVSAVEHVTSRAAANALPARKEMAAQCAEKPSGFDLQVVNPEAVP